MNFREVPIGAAFDVRNGATPASSEESYWDGNIPWVTPADLGGLCGREIAEGRRAITPKGYESCATQMVPAGSIILSIRAPVGHMAIAMNAMCFNQGCRGLIPRRIIRIDFAYWALLARRPQLEAAGQGTIFIELGRGKLRAERVPVPDLETQKVIADFLDRETARIDQLIEKKERQVGLLEEYGACQIHQAITRGLNSSALLTNSGVEWFGKIPAHWTIKPLRHVALFQRGHDLPADARIAGDVPLVSSGGISSEHNIAIAKAPGIVTGRYGTIGNFYFIERDYWPLNTTLFTRRIFERPRYVWYLLQDMAHIFVLNSSKAAVPGVDRNDIHSERVPVPPSDEQIGIAHWLDHRWVERDRFMSAIKLSVDRLRELRAALITAAVTGQIDVATWGKRGTTDRQLDAIESNMAVAVQPEWQQARA